MQFVVLGWSSGLFIRWLWLIMGFTTIPLRSSVLEFFNFSFVLNFNFRIRIFKFCLRGFKFHDLGHNVCIVLIYVVRIKKHYIWFSKGRCSLIFLKLPLTPFFAENRIILLFCLFTWAEGLVELRKIWIQASMETFLRYEVGCFTFILSETRQCWQLWSTS